MGFAEGDLVNLNVLLSIYKYIFIYNKAKNYCFYESYVLVFLQSKFLKKIFKSPLSGLCGK